MLTIHDVTKRFGGLVVIDNISLTIPEKTIFGLIGPNGAGKTTVFNLITGLLRPEAGSITYNDRELTAMPSYKITRTGIARTFQNIRIFSEMTLFENIMVGMHDHIAYNYFQTIFQLPSFRESEKKAKEKAYELLSWVNLAGKADQRAGSLSYGEQRKLELVRALATEPEMLLLDEPVAGMNPAETGELMEEIRNISGRGYGIILIDHDMKFIMGLCSEIAVLNFGSLIAQGKPEEIRNNKEVIEAYLGKEE